MGQRFAIGGAPHPRSAKKPVNILGGAWVGAENFPPVRLRLPPHPRSQVI
jgi:hypothetical protein